MIFDLIPFIPGFFQKQAVDEVVRCNDYTARYGLVLTPAQALELAETRSIALRDNGCIEFGGGVIDKIIREFCDSPHISMHNYAQTINELLEIFYYYKNETWDLVSDDDLITQMKSAFDGICQGSLDLLAGRELDRLARDLRSGRRYSCPGDDSSEDEEDEKDEEDEEDEDDEDER